MLLETSDEALRSELSAAGAMMTLTDDALEALAKRDCTRFEALLADPKLRLEPTDTPLFFSGHGWVLPSKCLTALIRSPKLVWPLAVRQSLSAASWNEPEVVAEFFARWPLEVDHQVCPTIGTASRFSADAGAPLIAALGAYTPKKPIDCSPHIEGYVLAGRELELDAFLRIARSLKLTVGAPTLGSYLHRREGSLSARELTFVAKLLSLGARADERGSGPLRWAAAHDDLKLAALLLEHGADPNAVFHFSERLRCTPLAVAAARGSVPMAKLLVGKGATTAAPFQLDGRCAAVSQPHDAGALLLSAEMRAVLPKAW